MTGVKVALTVALGGLEVASGTAQEILPKVLEKMPSKAQIDPGVTAAVEASQQHGDDERRGCRRDTARGELLSCDNKKTHFLCEGEVLSKGLSAVRCSDNLRAQCGLEAQFCIPHYSYLSIG